MADPQGASNTPLIDSEALARHLRQAPLRKAVPTATSLRRVFDHCCEVRSQCQAQHCTLHDWFAGTTVRTLVGGAQVTLDLAGAFDCLRKCKTRSPRS